MITSVERSVFVTPAKLFRPDHSHDPRVRSVRHFIKMNVSVQPCPKCICRLLWFMCCHPTSSNQQAQDPRWPGDASHGIGKTPSPIIRRFCTPRSRQPITYRPIYYLHLRPFAKFTAWSPTTSNPTTTASPEPTTTSRNRSTIPQESFIFTLHDPDLHPSPHLANSPPAGCGEQYPVLLAQLTPRSRCPSHDATLK